MRRLPAGVVLVLAAFLVTLLLLLIGQMPWAQVVREAASGTLANGAAHDPTGIAALILPIVKVLLVMVVPGLLAIGIRHFARIVLQRKQ